MRVHAVGYDPAFIEWSVRAPSEQSVNRFHEHPRPFIRVHPCSSAASVALGRGTGSLNARRITIAGRVQGVGFRPFVYRLAHELGLTGGVLNASGVVEVEAQMKAGIEAQLEAALAEIPDLHTHDEETFLDLLAVRTRLPYYYGVEQARLHEIIPAVVAVMAEAYPEIARRQELAQQTLQAEETNFRKTLRKGLELLRRALPGLAGRVRLTAVGCGSGGTEVPAPTEQGTAAKAAASSTAPATVATASSSTRSASRGSGRAPPATCTSA